MEYLILMVLVLLLCSVWGIAYILYRGKSSFDINTPTKNTEPLSKGDGINALVNLLKEEKEDAAREIRDKELREYANKKMKKERSGGIRSSGGMEEKPIRTNTRGELVQYGMSDRDKAILDEFYDGK